MQRYAIAPSNVLDTLSSCLLSGYNLTLSKDYGILKQHRHNAAVHFDGQMNQVFCRTPLSFLSFVVPDTRIRCSLFGGQAAAAQCSQCVGYLFPHQHPAREWSGSRHCGYHLGAAEGHVWLHGEEGHDHRPCGGLSKVGSGVKSSPGRLSIEFVCAAMSPAAALVSAVSEVLSGTVLSGRCIISMQENLLSMVELLHSLPLPSLPST